jgi:predicted nuclease of predicted toxin-antitoxin system
MRILANENVPGDAISYLRQNGYDVVWVREDLPGSSDIQVLERAQNDNRILITFDKDFGELAFRYQLPASSGIILFRISSPTPEQVALVAVAALDLREDWAGHFSVIEDTRIRMTPLPSSKE